MKANSYGETFRFVDMGLHCAHILYDKKRCRNEVNYERMFTGILGRGIWNWRC